MEQDTPVAISLTKGAKINLKKTSPLTTRFRASLGWRPNEKNTSQFDLDVTAFACRQVNGFPKVINPAYMVFFNSEMRTVDGQVSFRDTSDYHKKKGVPCSPCLGIVHTGDNTSGVNKDGSTSGENEALVVDLSKLPDSVDEISFVVTIHDAEDLGQNFGQIRDSFISIMDEDTGKVLATYPLDDTFSNETSVQFGSLVKKDDGSWEFQAIGHGYDKGLMDFVNRYVN